MMSSKLFLACALLVVAFTAHSVRCEDAAADAGGDSFDDLDLDNFDPSSLPPHLAKAWEELQNAVASGAIPDGETQQGFEDYSDDDKESKWAQKNSLPVMGEKGTGGSMKPESDPSDDELAALMADMDEETLAKELAKFGISPEDLERAGASGNAGDLEMNLDGEKFGDLENQLSGYVNQLKGMKNAQSELEEKLKGMEDIEGLLQGMNMPGLTGPDGKELKIDPIMLALDERMENIDKRLEKVEANYASIDARLAALEGRTGAPAKGPAASGDKQEL